MNRVLVLICLAAAWAPSLIHGATTCPSGVVAVDESALQAAIRVNWNETPTCRYENAAGRIDERMPVAVTVDHFNYLHYGLQLTPEEQVIEAYVELAEFWSKFFSFDIASIFEAQVLDAAARELSEAGEEDVSFEQVVFDWRMELHDRQTELSDTLSKYTSVALDDDQIDAIAQEVAGHEETLRKLAEFRSSALGLVNTNEELDLFERTDEAHARVIEAYWTFGNRAALVARGQKHQIAKKAAGTLVTVKVSAARLDGAAVDAGTETEVAIDYFVHSRYPLVFHAGPIYTDGLEQADFEAIGQLSGEDLFAKISDDEEDVGLAAFLSWQFLDFGGRHDQGAMLTFGTDFEDPGEKLYGGISLRWNRWILTAGRVWADAVEGDEMADADMEAAAMGDPNLFRTLRSGTEEGDFVALSFTVFGLN